MSENCHEQLDWPNFNLVFCSQLSPSITYPLRQREGGKTTVIGWREIEMMKITSRPAGEQLARPAGEQLVMTILNLYTSEIPALSINLKNEILRVESSLGVKMVIYWEERPRVQKITLWKRDARIPSFCGSTMQWSDDQIKGHYITEIYTKRDQEDAMGRASFASGGQPFQLFSPGLQVLLG